jgi:hypothetical protein
VVGQQVEGQHEDVQMAVGMEAYGSDEGEDDDPEAELMALQNSLKRMQPCQGVDLALMHHMPRGA